MTPRPRRLSAGDDLASLVFFPNLSLPFSFNFYIDNLSIIYNYFDIFYFFVIFRENIS